MSIARVTTPAAETADPPTAVRDCGPLEPEDNPSPPSETLVLSGRSRTPN
jgi:hypothetical protein